MISLVLNTLTASVVMMTEMTLIVSTTEWLLTHLLTLDVGWTVLSGDEHDR